MDYFDGITNPKELKLRYRRLAMLNHPDMGGDSDVMKKINYEFNELENNLGLLHKSKYGELKINDRVLVNNSFARVTYSGPSTLIIQSETTKRQAAFCKKTGICFKQPKFKIELIKPIYHGI